METRKSYAFRKMLTVYYNIDFLTHDMFIFGNRCQPMLRHQSLKPYQMFFLCYVVPRRYAGHSGYFWQYLCGNILRKFIGIRKESLYLIILRQKNFSSYFCISIFCVLVAIASYIPKKIIYVKRYKNR